MKKFIHATKEQQKELERIFKCCNRTVRNALTYDEERGESDLCRKIRFAAKQKGCHTYVVVNEFECFFDADDIMWCLFPNGAQLSVNKITGEGEIVYKGDVVARYDNVSFKQIPVIQQRAMAI